MSRAAGAQATEHRLPNGLQLLIVRGADTRDIEVTAGYFVGMLDDSLRGIAHLMEHVAMRETRDGRSLAARYRELAIDGGASTSSDITIFPLRGRGGLDMLDTLLALQRRRMADLALTENALTTERRSIHTEQDGRARDPWTDDLFDHHRLRSDNKHSDLDRIDRKKLVAFYQKYYQPANAALVIVSAIPDSTVVAHVSSTFGALASGAPLPRPVFRDSSVVANTQWRGTLDGQRVIAATVWGPQDVARLSLESSVDRARSSVNRLGVTVSLGTDAPVSVLVLATRDTGDAERRLGTALGSVADQPRSGVGEWKHAARLEGAELLRCEAAGTWRYCLADSTAAVRSAPDLASLLTTSPPTSGKVLWPHPLRAAPTAASAAAAPTRTREWRDPGTDPVRWHRTASGLAWMSQPGGFDDSVFVGLIVGANTASPSAKQIVALELWARCWKNLRLSSGEAADSVLRVHGASISIRSLPYPTLATTEAFRLLGVPPTPLGVYGIELLISVPRNEAATVLPLLHRIMREARLDSAAFVAAKTEQLDLLRSNLTGPQTNAEVAMRQRLIQVDANMRARFSPEAPSAQLSTMTELALADVNGVGPSLASTGRGRLVILGATEGAARDWISRSGWSSLQSLEWPTNASCPPADTVTEHVRVGGGRPQTTLHVFSCFARRSTRSSDAADDVANAVLAGSEDALMSHRLRAELGVAYSLSSRILTVSDASLGAWLLTISTPTSGIDETIREIRAVLARAADQGPSRELFESARTIVMNQRRREGSDGVPWVTRVLWRGRSPEEEMTLLSRVQFDEVRRTLAAIARLQSVAFLRTDSAP